MRLFLLLPFAAFAGCAALSPQAPAPSVADPVSDAALPPPPPPTAVTVEDFDTTSATDRAQAVASAADAGRALGTTIASLGSPAEPGIWLKTPLVSVVTQGRVTYLGTSINIELRPSGGAAGSGSQISLAAMRLIEVPLTSLPELTVYAL